MVFNANRLKVQLKLAQNRLKMLQAKKTNQNAGARKEIAKLLDKGKEESARIKVEHIILDDYLMEAMELLELFCDLLLARFGMIEQLKLCDDSIKEPVCTLIWVAPRMMTTVDEFKAIHDQLISKYGKEFALAAMENRDECVSERLMRKFDIGVPDSKLVDSYLIEIAKSHSVKWQPVDPLSDAKKSAMEAFEDDVVIPPPHSTDDDDDYGNAGNVAAAFPPQGAPMQVYPPPGPQPKAYPPPGPQPKVYPPPAPSGKGSQAPTKPSNDSDLPDLPPPPSDMPSNSREEEGPDFDDLTARFAALKKRGR